MTMQSCRFASRTGFRVSVVLAFAAIVTMSLAGARRARAQSTPVPQSTGQQKRILVGYFPQWGLYNETPYTVKDLVESGGARMLDQINYAQGFVTNGHCSVADPNADLNYTFTAENSVDGTPDSPAQPLRGNFHQLQELKRLYPQIKILVSLEGHSTDFATDAQPENRAAFVASCVDVFLRGNIAPGVSAAGLFDGIDVDWEYPKGDNGANYIALLEEFRKQMDALHPGLLLSAALGPSPHMYGNADTARMGQLLDRAGLMTYDFNGPWSRRTGFIAPLASTSPDEETVQRCVTSWLSAGIPAEKLLVGLPFYGYQWHDVPDVDHGFGQDGKPNHGDRPYRMIQSLIVKPATLAHEPAAASPASQPPSSEKHPAATGSVPPPGETATAQSAAATSADASAESGGLVLYRDPVSQAPWLFDGDSFWTYEDPTSIRSKASYVAQQQLGGFMVWELSEDTTDGALLSAAHSALLHPEAAAEDESAGVPVEHHNSAAQ